MSFIVVHCNVSFSMTRHGGAKKGGFGQNASSTRGPRWHDPAMHICNVFWMPGSGLSSLDQYVVPDGLHCSLHDMVETRYCHASDSWREPYHAQLATDQIASFSFNRKPRRSSTRQGMVVATFLAMPFYSSIVCCCNCKIRNFCSRFGRFQKRSTKQLFQRERANGLTPRGLLRSRSNKGTCTNVTVIVPRIGAIIKLIIALSVSHSTPDSVGVS